MKEKHLYICEQCGTEYIDKRLAEMCEAFVMDASPVQAGDKVKVYERYDSPEDDEVVAVSVVSNLGHLLSDKTLEDAAHLDMDKFCWHTYGVEVKNSHRMSKDYDSDTNKVNIDNIMVGDFWQSFSDGKLNPKKFAA